MKKQSFLGADKIMNNKSSFSKLLKKINTNESSEKFYQHQRDFSFWYTFSVLLQSLL